MQKLLVLLLILYSTQAISQNNLSDWKTKFTIIEEKEYMGRKAFHMGKGLAWLPASNFDNGEIEVDIAPVAPGLAGITFHMDDSFNYDEVYIRYAKSGGPDALQYSPEFNGELSWQFYPEYQAAVVYPNDQWLHLKIIVQDKKAAVYVLNSDTAILFIDSLRIPNRSGFVGFWTLADTYFSNYRYHSTSSVPLFTIASKIIRNKDAITSWQVSEPFLFSDTLNTYPANNTKFKWKKADTEPDGFLNINKFARKKIWGRTRNNSNDAVWLKYEWDEIHSGTKPFSFEFSNRCFIYLNGQLLFSGNNSFLLKGPLYRGDIDKEMKANTLFLPVKKGGNTILIAVASITNGWGFMAQFADGNNTKTKAF